jgi:serine/threonine protein kinase
MGEDRVGGRYRLEEVLGEGGWGLVYRAFDEHLGRMVALKMLHADLCDEPSIQARFEREALLARSLDHPHVVRLLDHGRDGSGALYIAYELLEGRPLDELLAEGPLPVHRAARIGEQVLTALMEAHRRGVVHRDIKPSNIFLCAYAGEVDFVKVLDFGIAKAVGERALTAAGSTIGTPSYMAPEQVRGAAVSPATDLYALGLVLAEAIGGEVVVDGSTVDVVAEQLSPAPLRLAPPVLRSPLAPAIRRALEKRPERRFTSAAHMLEALLDARRALEPGALALAPTLAAAPALTEDMAARQQEGAPDWAERRRPERSWSERNWSERNWSERSCSERSWPSAGVAAALLVTLSALVWGAWLIAGELGESDEGDDVLVELLPSSSAAKRAPTLEPVPAPGAELRRCEAIAPGPQAFSGREADLEGALADFAGSRCLDAADTLELTRACFRSAGSVDMRLEVEGPLGSCALEVRSLELDRRFIHVKSAGEDGQPESYIAAEGQPRWGWYYRGASGQSSLCTGRERADAETSPRMRAEWGYLVFEARAFFCGEGATPVAPRSQPTRTSPEPRPWLRALALR